MIGAGKSVFHSLGGYARSGMWPSPGSKPGAESSEGSTLNPGDGGVRPSTEPWSGHASTHEHSLLCVRGRTASAAALLLLCVALTGCVPQGLAFRVDDRLSFSSPEERSTVRLPLTLEWSIRDFDIVEPGGPVRKDSGYFAVFFDRSPMPPNEHLRWLAREDISCRADDRCPDEEYLNARGVYTTTNTRLVLEHLPRTTDPDDRQDRKERHRAIVVLLDASGRRIGESAFEIVFDVERSIAS